MIQNRPLTVGRINAFANRLREKIYTNAIPLTLRAYAAPDRIPYAEAIKGSYQPITLGHSFGKNWSTHWVKADFTIPKELQNQKWHLRWSTRSEGCVWLDGEPLQSFAPGHRTAFALAPAHMKGGKGSFYIEVAVNNLFGAETFADRMPWMGQGIGTLEIAEIAVFHQARWDLLMDFVIICEMAQELPEKSQRTEDALFVANAIVSAVDFDDDASCVAGRAIAHAFLSETASPAVHQLSAIGHAHLDLAWLWPVAESKRKAYRTLATAVRFMDQYPSYKFVCSQMQVWDWIKNSFPKLYQKMLKKVRSGQLIPCGGTWVEPDCNLPSLESLTRQFLFGQRFMKQEFGFYSKVFWNPDVFGYSAQLPQILKASEIDYFLTQKMSWNQYNKFPHSSFIWEGLDGSRVLTHFPPADTYNCSANVKEVLFNVSNDKSKALTRESYMLYGFGDGGSGPTEEMIERVARMGNLEGLPAVQQRSPNEFFERLEKDAPKFHTWVGELYLELHRGCQTSQARNKWANRKCENLLREIEMLYTLYDLSHYPQEELADIWKKVLLNQFHDIIPGSSIHEVYEVTSKEYAELHVRLALLRDAILQKVSGKSGTNTAVFNTHAFDAEQVIQRSDKSYALVSAPAFGHAIVSEFPKYKEKVTAKKVGQFFVLENPFVKAKFNKEGQLVSFFDKHADREVIAEGSVGNDLVIYDDYTNYWDAWDIEAFHVEKILTPPKAKSIEISCNNPLHAALTVVYAIGEKSTMTQVISLDLNVATLVFSNEVDWFEQHKLLKVEFPWNVHAQNAAYEVPGGYVLRPTHENTSWDMARFEVCAHRWADLSEPAFGVALMNDSKYGYRTIGNRMCLSLLRGPTYPDETADQGHHRFAYAIYPHECATADANLHQRAALFNEPLLLCSTAKKPTRVSLLSVEGDNVCVTALKKAEDSKDIILRFYETDGVHSSIILHPKFAFKRVTHVNNLEHDLEDVPFDTEGVALDINPFEIITLKFSV